MTLECNQTQQANNVLEGFAGHFSNKSSKAVWLLYVLGDISTTTTVVLRPFSLLMQGWSKYAITCLHTLQ